MPLASQKRVEGVSRFGRNRSGRWSQSVAIGRDWSRLVAIRCTEDTEDTEGKAPKTSRKLDFVFDFVRNRSQSVAIRCTEGKAQTQKKPDSSIGESGHVLSQGVARLYASANSSAK